MPRVGVYAGVRQFRCYCIRPNVALHRLGTRVGQGVQGEPEVAATHRRVAVATSGYACCQWLAGALLVAGEERAQSWPAACPLGGV